MAIQVRLSGTRPFLFLSSHPDKRVSFSRSPDPENFTLAKDKEEESQLEAKNAQAGPTEQISAADYDPSLDRREDEQKRVYPASERQEEMMEEVEVVEEEVEEDDLDDMFAVANADRKVKKVTKVKKVIVSRYQSCLLSFYH